MKMIEQQPPPGPLHILLRIGSSIKNSQRRNLLRIQKRFFRAANALLGICLGRENTAVVLEIEFALPSGYVHLRKFLFQVLEELGGGAEWHIRKHCARRLQAHRRVEHCAGWPSTVIAHPK